MGRNILSQDAHFMRMALQEAKSAAAQGQTPFGAVVVDRGGRLVSRGHNEARMTQDPSAHGEVVAIRNAWKRFGTWQKLEGCTLYTSCEPCLLCSFVIAQVGLSRVVYAARGTDVPTYRPLMGADFEEAAVWINAQPDWRHISILKDFMRDDAIEILASFSWNGDYAAEVKSKRNET